MGLSSKQVSGDGLDWPQNLLKNGILETPKPAVGRGSTQQQQRMPPLKCPRCESTNTKFCYYNNYSRSQPRYLCKACRRHWTEGGTLRNVPVGGARKAKRAKTSAHDSTAAAAAANNEEVAMALLPFGGAARESSIFPDVLRRVLLQPPQPAPPSDYSGFMGPLASSSPFQHQFAGIEPVAVPTSSFNISPFTLSSSSSSLLSEEFAPVNASPALGTSWLQALPELPPCTRGMGSTDDASCDLWTGWEDDITGLVEPERAHTKA